MFPRFCTAFVLLELLKSFAMLSITFWNPSFYFFYPTVFQSVFPFLYREGYEGYSNMSLLYLLIEYQAILRSLPVNE